MDIYEQPRSVASPDWLRMKYLIEHTRLENHRYDRDKIVRAFDAVPYGLRAEYLRQRRERLQK